MRLLNTNLNFIIFLIIINSNTNAQCYNFREYCVEDYWNFKESSEYQSDNCIKFNVSQISTLDSFEFAGKMVPLNGDFEVVFGKYYINGTFNTGVPDKFWSYYHKDSFPYIISENFICGYSGEIHFQALKDKRKPIYDCCFSKNEKSELRQIEKELVKLRNEFHYECFRQQLEYNRKKKYLELISKEK
jgi:hypothetical protein